MDPLALEFRIQVNYASLQEHVPEAKRNKAIKSSRNESVQPTTAYIQMPTLHHGEGSH
jgi:hypothetical protein